MSDICQRRRILPLEQRAASRRAHLMEQLKDLRSARELVNFIAAQNWEQVDADARAVSLHEINAAICRLREKLGQPPIDDGLPGEPDTPYRTIRAIVLSPSPHHEGAHRGEA